MGKKHSAFLKANNLAREAAERIKGGLKGIKGTWVDFSKEKNIINKEKMGDGTLFLLILNEV